MTVPDPDPRVAADPSSPGGLVDGGTAELPGVQDLGPADAGAEDEGDGPVEPADEEY